MLLLTLIIGQVTRGTVRWIPIGGSAFQASEIVRPFLMLFYAKIVSESKVNFKNISTIILAGIVPVVLIAIQPSLGVSIITLFGLLAIFAAKFIKGKSIITLILFSLLAMPVAWFTMKPYQKDRILVFFNYEKDPKGAGYNAIQSIISVGSGGILGRGFKKGFQTQLEYLPEKHTDFIFAGISEEMGFVGAFTVLLLLYLLFYRMLRKAFKSNDEVYKLFTIGVVVVFLVETIVNVGMNVGILPITGLPLPLVSAGGSSLLSSMISIALVVSGVI
jgi:rod shape determining protein RodA